MTNLEQAVVDTFAVLATLDEEGPAPECVIYLALGADHIRFSRMKRLAVEGGLATSSGNILEITDRGREFLVKN